MPAAFDKCQKEGGEIITKQLSGKHYIHLCKDKSGRWHKGYKKTYQGITKDKK